MTPYLMPETRKPSVFEKQDRAASVVGELVKTAMDRRGIGVAEMARRSALRTDVVRDLYEGELDVSLFTLVKVLDVMGLDLYDVLVQMD